MKTTILYWVNSVEMLGGQIIELKSTEIENHQQGDIIPDYDELPEGQLKEIGNLTQEHAEDMETKDIEPGNEDECIKYAKEVLKYDIPENYILVCYS